MKLLITESQKQRLRLLKEEPFLTDILKKAIVRAIESPEVQKIIKKGMEKIETERGKVNSIRYAYTGELETDIWYDDNGRWVGMQFMGRDGSLIKYICKKCSGPLAKEQKPNG